MMKIGNRMFDTENNTYIMGILNVTCLLYTSCSFQPRCGQEQSLHLIVLHLTSFCPPILQLLFPVMLKSAPCGHRHRTVPA